MSMNRRVSERPFRCTFWGTEWWRADKSSSWAWRVKRTVWWQDDKGGIVKLAEKLGTYIARNDLVRPFKHHESWSHSPDSKCHMSKNFIVHHRSLEERTEMVEKPQIYLTARCRNTTEEQFLSSDSHLDDIQQLTTESTSSHNVPIKDICRIFHGDHPSQDVKSGHQIGGNFGCYGCTAASAQYFDHA